VCISHRGPYVSRAYSSLCCWLILSLGYLAGPMYWYYHGAVSQLLLPCCPCCLPCIQLPFFVTLINCVWVGLWTGITFTTVILVVLEYSMDAFSDTISADALEHRHNMTMVR